MRKIKKFGTLLSIIAIAFLLSGWGSTGHRHIAINTYLSFNTEMQDFNDWMAYLEAHSSDADYRKSEDPNEGVRHYIDIDNYSEFITSGYISQSWDSVIATHGESFVYNNGVLPWITIQTYDSLVNCMKRYDWEKSQYFAADLSHYVADGFMPMHLTNNYDGKLTGNSGIHSRYESTMINAHINEIVFTGQEIGIIENTSDYVFQYIYKNYPYVDSILAADDYAKTISSSTSSTDYKNALWQKTAGFTGKLLNNASTALAELMYNAWIEAGKPNLKGTSTGYNSEMEIELNVYPNPAHELVHISVTKTTNNNLRARVINTGGEVVAVLTGNNIGINKSEFSWKVPQNITGLFFIEVKTDEGSIIKKVLVNN